MTKDDAHQVSKSGLIWRQKDDRLLMFHAAALAEHVSDNGKGVQQGFYTQMHHGKIRRFAGVTLKDYDDWKPCNVGTNAHNIFLARFSEPPNESSKDWTGAIGASPVNTAMRTDKDGCLMVRKSKDRTWREVPSMHEMIQVRGGFRHYDGWEPMPADHPLAKLDWREERFPYRNPKFPHAMARTPQDIAEWVQTGSFPALRDHQERCRKDTEARNPETIKMQPRRVIPNTEIGLQELVKDCLDIVVDTPEPHVLQNLGVLAEAVSVGIKAMVDIGQNDLATELAGSLKHLVGNASWLLRSDRTEWAKRKAGDK